LRELSSSPDETGQLDREIVVALSARSRSIRCVRGFVWRRRIFHDPHRGDEPISPARHGLDKPRRFTRVAKRLSDAQNRGVNARVRIGVNVRAP
jgi:hypothetical protein